MQVAPLGFITIPDAIKTVLRALYPKESEEMQAYDLASTYGWEAQDLLLSGLLSEPGLGVVFKTGVAVLVLPLDYWTTPGGSITLTTDRLVANVFSLEDLAELHGEACFLSEPRFNLWLERMLNVFDRPYWTYRMVLIWVYSGDRVLVRRAAAAEWNKRPSLLMSCLTIRKGAGPRMSMSKAKLDTDNKLQIGKLNCTGLRNGKGDREQIGADKWWEGMEILIDESGKHYAGRSEHVQTGATIWHELRFDRNQVLALWPDLELPGSQSRVLVSRGGRRSREREAAKDILMSIYPTGIPPEKTNAELCGEVLAKLDGRRKCSERTIRRARTEIEAHHH